jgi:Amt family ammonium transporter
MIRKILCGAGVLGATLLTASTAFAQAAPALVNVAKLSGAAQTAAEAALTNKGDTTWMLVSSVLVLMMSIPGLALFYGGLVRTKNMLSVLMRCS